MFHAVSHFPLMRRRWAQAKRDLRLWQYAPVSPLPCHVLNRECVDISIMSKMSTVGAGVRAGSILWEGWWGRGGWWGPISLHHWAAPQLGSHGSLIYVWMTLITSLYTLRGMGLLQMGLWGIGRVEASFKWSDKIGLCRAACTKKRNDLNPLDGHSGED